MKFELKHFLKQLVVFGTLLVVLVTVGRMFVFDLIQIDSYQMVPNLIAGDYVIVYKATALGPGDVAVCRNPEEPGSYVVLRIMGVPGSTIAMQGSSVFINDQLMDGQSAGHVLYTDLNSPELLEYYASCDAHYMGGHAFKTAYMDKGGNRIDFRHQVSSGFFLMADNGGIGRDSRHFGEVPIKECIGRVVMLLWPAEDNGDFKREDRFPEFF